MFSELTIKDTQQPEKIPMREQRAADPSNSSPQAKTVDKIKTVVLPTLRALGLELFDVQFSGAMKGGHLRVMIDKADGVTVEDCAKVSRYLRRTLDIDEDMPEDYTLEVSSPGIDRPLRTESDFRRFIGKTIKIDTGIKIDQQNSFRGRLIDFKEQQAFLILDGGVEKAIPFDQIEKARLTIDPAFGRNKGGLKK